MLESLCRGSRGVAAKGMQSGYLKLDFLHSPGLCSLRHRVHNFLFEKMSSKSLPLPESSFPLPCKGSSLTELWSIVVRISSSHGSPSLLCPFGITTQLSASPFSDMLSVNISTVTSDAFETSSVLCERVLVPTEDLGVLASWPSSKKAKLSLQKKMPVIIKSMQVFYRSH